MCAHMFVFFDPWPNFSKHKHKHTVYTLRKCARTCLENWNRVKMIFMYMYICLFTLQIKCARTGLSFSILDRIFPNIIININILFSLRKCARTCLENSNRVKNDIHMTLYLDCLFTLQIKCTRTCASVQTGHNSFTFAMYKLTVEVTVENLQVTFQCVGKHGIETGTE